MASDFYICWMLVVANLVGAKAKRYIEILSHSKRCQACERVYFFYFQACSISFSFSMLYGVAAKPAVKYGVVYCNKK